MEKEKLECSKKRRFSTNHLPYCRQKLSFVLHETEKELHRGERRDRA
jgi:hypothetical protein